MMRSSFEYLEKCVNLEVWAIIYLNLTTTKVLITPSILVKMKNLTWTYQGYDIQLCLYIVFVVCYKPTNLIYNAN